MTRHSEDCLVQMCTDGMDDGRRFFKCPHVWSSDAPENCGFTRWVDPAPIDSVQEFIEYLQIKIFDLECKVK